MEYFTHIIFAILVSLTGFLSGEFIRLMKHGLWEDAILEQPLLEIVTDDVMQCGRHCRQTPGCWSIVFNTGQRICQLTNYTQEFVDPVATIASPGAIVYMVMSMDLECLPFTTSTPATSVFLEGGTIATISFHSEVVDQATATSRCTTYGGSLVKILTVEKQKALQFLANCPGFVDNSGYWLDATCGADPNVWHTSDGELVPMTADFWNLAHSRSPGRCVRMDANQGFLWNDIPCTNTYSFICDY